MFSFAAWTLIAMGKAKYERKNHPTQDTQMASHIPCRILVHCSCTDKRETYQQPYSSVNSGYWHWWMAKHPFQRLRTLVRTLLTLSCDIVESSHGPERVACCGYWEEWHVMGWVHGAFYEQALPWQMGPHGIPRALVPPCGRPPAPGRDWNSHPSCLCLCHLRLF